MALDLITLTPDVIENHIEDGHGDGGDPLAQSQGYGVVLQAGSAQCQRTGYQAEGVSRAQHHSHHAEEPVLTPSLAAPDHKNSDGNDGDEIDRVKQGLYNCLHNEYSFRSVLLFDLYQPHAAARTALP